MVVKGLVERVAGYELTVVCDETSKTAVLKTSRVADRPPTQVEIEALLSAQSSMLAKAKRVLGCTFAVTKE